MHAPLEAGAGPCPGSKVGWAGLGGAGASSEPAQEVPRAVRDKTEVLCWQGRASFRPGPAGTSAAGPSGFRPTWWQAPQTPRLDFLPGFTETVGL